MVILPRLRWAADTLSGRLALVFALFVLPPTIISVFLSWNFYVEYTARAKLQVRQFATLTATYESKFFDDVRRTLQHLAADGSIREGGAARCNETLGAAAQRTPEFASVGFYDFEGSRICGIGDELENASNRGWLRDVRRFRGFVISDYTVTPNSPYPVIVAAQAVYGTDGRLQGVLAASIRLYWLSAFIREISLPPQSVFFLIDSNGNILADRAAVLDESLRGAPQQAEDKRGLGTLTAIVGQEYASAVLSRSVTDFAAAGTDGVRRVFSSVALPHGDVTVLFGMPAVSTFGWLEKDLINRVLGIAAILLGGLGAAWLGTRYLVTRWTSSLRKMARAYGRGSYAEKPDFARAPRELRDLGETLALMAHRIEVREAELRTSIEQKDIILKEIHHRVKNNLQIVSSLLNIRGGGIRGDVERAVLDEIKAHVRALALVHRHLYESDDIQRVDLRAFMTELCQGALSGLARASQGIRLDLSIPEFMISTDRAIPIALLVTEAMTNSLKHAFPHGRGGTIRVAFEPTGPSSGKLTVADDGVGFAKDGDAAPGMGMQLLEAFAKQIGGTLELSGPPGTVVEVTVDDSSAPAADASANGSERRDAQQSGDVADGAERRDPDGAAA